MLEATYGGDQTAKNEKDKPRIKSRSTLLYPQCRYIGEGAKSAQAAIHATERTYLRILSRGHLVWDMFSTDFTRNPPYVSI